MNDFYEIYQLKFVTSVFDLSRMEPGTATHYIIDKEGMLKIYETPYNSRKHQNLQKIKLSEAKVKEFFWEISELLASAKHPVYMEDDRARHWVISYENHTMEIDGDLETDDGRNIENSFWNFINSIK